jgi:hypothetical protein
MGDLGEALVHVAFSRLKFALHPLPRRDRGIDGVVETADHDGRTTGRYIAVQFKGGKSWFDRETDEGFVFKIDRGHLEYWLSNSLPVVVLLADPHTELVHWATVTPTSVEPAGENYKLVVPRTQIVNEASRQALADLATAPSDAIGALVDAEVQRLRASYAEGQRHSAVAALTNLADSVLWRFASAHVQSGGLLELAIWSVEAADDVETAKRVLQRLKRVGAECDTSLVEALIALREADAVTALAAISPATTGRAYDFAVRLRLAVNGVANAQQAIDDRPSDLPPAGESNRVYALVHFINGHRSDAIAALDDALKATPKRWWLRHTRGVLKLVSCFPASTASVALADVPDPIPLALASHDDDSLNRLRAAADIFRILREDTDDRQLAANAAVWHLACLACDPDAEEQAGALTAELLQEEETVSAAVPWAVARGVPFDTGDVVRRLSALAQDGAKARRLHPARVVSAILSALVAHDDFSGAAKALKKHRTLLRAANPDLPVEWDARLAAAAKDYDRAVRTAERMGCAERREDVLRTIEHLRADHGGAWQEAARLHEQAHASGGDVKHLLAALDYRVRHRDSVWIDEHGDQVLRNIRNEYTVRAVAVAAWQLDRGDRVISVLDGWFAVSTANTPGLKQLLISALIRVDARRAAREAQQLLSEMPTAANAYLAMQAFVRILDLKQLALAGRALVAASDVDTQMLLAAAVLTRVDEATTSRLLTSRAIEKKIADVDVPLALMLANQLNLRDEAEALFARLPEVAKRTTTVKAISPQELVAHARRHEEKVAEVAKGYFAAVVPMHIVAPAFSMTLAEWFGDVAEDATLGRPTQRPPLLTRFHALSIQERDLSKFRLHMDLTALLLAAELDVLDVVERTYTPLFVSSLLSLSLFEQRRSVREAVPDGEAYRAIADLLMSGNLHTIRASASSAAIEVDPELAVFIAAAPPQAVYVDTEPVDTITDRRRVPLTSYAARLRAASVISASEASVLAADKDGDGPSVLKSTTEVVLSGAAAIALANARVLPRVTARQRVSVTDVFGDQCRRIVETIRRRDRTGTMLERLMERLRVGIENKTYVTTPVSNTTDVASDVAALQDLLRGRLSSQDAIWIDDRASSRLKLAAPVLGVTDVLADLRRRGAISEATHLEKLSLLRAMGVRFLPLNIAEVVGRIAASPTPELFDTREMLILTHEVAASALDPALVRSEDPLTNEFVGVNRDSRIVRDVLPSVWLAASGTDINAADMSAAIVERLYFSPIGTTGIYNPNTPPEVFVNVAATELVGFYSLVVAIGVKEGAGALDPNSATTQFAKWITRTFAMRRFRSDPAVIDVAARQFRAIVEPIRGHVASMSELNALTDTLISVIFMLLPEELQRAATAQDGDFWRSLGIEAMEVVGIGSRNVPDAEFWRAVKSGAVRTVEGTRVLAISIDDEETLLDEPLLVHLAQGSPEEWRAWVNDRSDLFDMPHSERSAVANEIAGESDMRERVRRAVPALKRSAFEGYRRLAQLLRHAGTFDETAFILPIASLADHLRIPADGRREMSLEIWQTAAAELWSDLSAEEALARIITVPMPVPDLVYASIAECAEIEKIIRTLAVKARAPVSLMHLAALAVRLAENYPSLSELAREITESVLSPSYGDNEFATFEAILFVVSAELSHDRDGETYGPTLRYMLAWSHAARIQELMAGENQEKVRNFFKSITLTSRESLTRDSALLAHSLAPHYIDPLRSVVHGLGVLLQPASRMALEQTGVAEVMGQLLLSVAEKREMLALILDPDLFVGKAQSIFEGDRSVVLGHVLGEDIEAFSSAATRAMLQKLMDDGRNDVAGDWSIHFAMLLRQLPLYEDFREPFRELAWTITSDDVARTRDAGVFLLTALADQIGVWGTGEDRKHVEDLFLEHLRRRATIEDEVFDDLFAMAYLDIVFALAAEQGSANRSARGVATLIERAIDAWPRLGYRLAMQISTFVWWLPLDQAGPLWRFILRARERSSDVIRS